MPATTPRQAVPSATWLAIAATTIIGLGLRILAARGDYWLDEAWSALFAHEAGTPGRVLFAINHDNNHFLNTLWLQAIGWGAMPILGRALSIVTGTAAITVAGLIGARRGFRPAALAAALFALSPILVTYGSEARGYAPMLLALLCAIWIVDRDLNGTPLPRAPQWLGLAALFGMLAHVSMLVGIAALMIWVAAQQARSMGAKGALRATARLFGRAVAAVAAVLLMIAIAAAFSPEGFRMGTRTAFAWGPFVDALAYMLAFTVGWPFRIGFWLLPILLLPAVLTVRGRGIFQGVAIIGLPVAVALLQPGNSAFPRYYLLSAVALLLLLADLLAARRWSLLLAGAMLAGSLVVDARIIADQRGRPGEAVDAMARRGPGAMVLADEAKDSAVLEAAAVSRRYGLRVATQCDPAISYLFAENNGTVALPRWAARCGASFQALASGQSATLSGMAWQLYERVP